MAVPTITFYTIGTLKKRNAKKTLDGIADEYNYELELRQAAKLLQFEFGPTVFLDRQSNTSYGASVSLSF